MEVGIGSIVAPIMSRSGDDVPSNFSEVTTFFTDPDNMRHIKTKGPSFFVGDKVYHHKYDECVVIVGIEWKDVPLNKRHYGGWWYEWKFVEGDDGRHGSHEALLRRKCDHNDITYWLKA